MGEPTGLHRASAVVWYVFVVLLVALMAFGGSWLSGFAFGWFLGVESIGVIDGKEGDTFTEFARWKVADRASRFALGAALAWLAYVRSPPVLAPWFAGALLIWLPPHLAFPGVERRVWDAVRGALGGGR